MSPHKIVLLIHLQSNRNWCFAILQIYWNKPFMIYLIFKKYRPASILFKELKPWIIYYMSTRKSREEIKRLKIKLMNMQICIMKGRNRTINKCKKWKHMKIKIDKKKKNTSKLKYNLCFKQELGLEVLLKIKEVLII